MPIVTLKLKCVDKKSLGGVNPIPFSPVIKLVKALVSFQSREENLKKTMRGFLNSSKPAMFS